MRFTGYYLSSLSAVLLGALVGVHCGASSASSPPTASNASHVPVESPPAAASSSAMTPSQPAPPSSESNAKPVAPSPEAVARLAKDSNAFGFDLYQRLRSEKGNLVISPASITMAMTMAWGGAKGQTAEQMKKVLHLEGTQAEVMQASGVLANNLQDPNRSIAFHLANRLFGEKSYNFEASFLDATKAAFGAPLESVNFKSESERSRGHINQWVEQQTEARIKDLLPAGSISPDTRMVLVNAIYFLGDWREPFSKGATKNVPFFLTATNKKSVPTMHGQMHAGYVEKDGLKALSLPYKGDQMSMLVVLPSKVDGVSALEASLSNAKLEDIVGSLKPQTVNVALPKFEINPTASLALADRLRQMGMTLPFDPHADFTGMANPPDPNERLYLSNVFHKAFVRVDEKGTEAAAATGGVMMRASAAVLDPVSFHADRPFVFFIRDNATGLILFSGRVSDPLVKS